MVINWLTLLLASVQEGDGEENVDADKLHTGLLERLLCMKEENAAIPVTEEKLV